eukprot:1032294-Pyramimonas_sp.AAC.1
MKFSPPSACPGARTSSSPREASFPAAAPPRAYRRSRQAWSRQTPWAPPSTPRCGGARSSGTAGQ